MKKKTNIPFSIRHIYFLAFAEGAAVMTLELIGGRMMAPTYGSSLAVWTSILGIIMAALAFGYSWGGNKLIHTKVEVTIPRLFVIAAFLFIIMPRLANLTNDWFYFDSFTLSVLLSSLFLLFFPAALLGASTPLLVKQLNELGCHEGKASGHIYGVSTLGGITFTFVVGFWLVPTFGLTATAFVVGMFISILPLLILIKQNNSKYGFLFPVLLILGILLNFAKPEMKDVKVIHQSEGLLGQLLVVDQPKDNAQGYNRILFVNHMGQTWIDQSSGNSMWGYPNYLAVLASSLPPQPNVLLLGIGGGTVANLLINTVQADVDVVELDQRISKIAHEKFALDSRAKVTIDDARHALRTLKKKYDIIIFDVFKGEVPPAHVLSLETFNQCKENLNEGGFIIVNFNGFIDGTIGRASRSVAKTILAAGYQMKYLPTYGKPEERNNLFIASIKELTFDSTRVKMNIYNKPADMRTLFYSLDSIPFEPSDKVLTDDLPVLEILNLEAAQNWRKTYNELFTKKFANKGIPVFK